MPNKKLRHGFTLIELLVVVSIIAILSTVVFVALNPVKRFADARNSRRFSDVNEVLTSIHEYIVDNGGALPTGLTTAMAAKELGTCGTCANLTTPLAKYLKSIPLDPQSGTASNSGYTVAVDTNNIVTINSTFAENAVSVQVSR